MKRFGLFILCAAVLVPGSYAADPAAVASPDGSVADVGQPEPAGNASDSAPSVDSHEGKLSRWLDLKTLSFGMRYRNAADTDGVHLYDDGQQRSLIEGRVKLDAEGKYSINFRVSSGRDFTRAYTDVVGGTFADNAPRAVAAFPADQAAQFAQSSALDPSALATLHEFGITRGWEMSARQFYMSASPIKQLTFEYGSLGLNRGFGTEITTYDEDGYITGGRLLIHDPSHLFVDEVSVTYGYEGDYFTPNFFGRVDRLSQSNYHQFLVSKKLFGKRLGVSADFTGDKATHTMREAVYARIQEARMIDSLRLELYQRLNDRPLLGYTFPAAAGYAVTGSKTFRKNFQLEGGYAQIDADYTVLGDNRILDVNAYALNGDAFSIGNRLFARANYKASSYLSFFGFYTHQINTDFYNQVRQGMNFGVTIDFKSMLVDKLHLL